MGCGEEEQGTPPDRRPNEAAEPRDKRVTPARCPTGAANCTSATGTIVYVERVDPDGDGDAHFVLLDSQGVTAPQTTVVDVAAELRPRPLPRPGDELSAAGPVFRGSYGQRQIEADVVNVAR